MARASVLHTLARHRIAGTLAGLIVLCLALWIATPFFATFENIRNVVEQSTIIGIVAIGMTFVILTGGIDLSTGSLVALAGVVTALVMRSTDSWLLGILAGIAIGGAAGAANGLLVTMGRLPPFIATLGMMSVARGAALMLSDGRPISGFPDALRQLATVRLLGVPIAVLLMLLLYVLSHLVLNRTVFGRYVYAIGGNEEAARLSGVRVSLHKTLVYVIAGVTTALCSALLLARLNSAQPIAGIGYELDAIAAVVIGGTSLLGGGGSVIGTLIGALIMSVLRNGLNLLGVSSYVQQIAIGAVIVIAVLIDMALHRRAQRPAPLQP